MAVWLLVKKVSRPTTGDDRRTSQSNSDAPTEVNAISTSTSITGQTQFTSAMSGPSPALAYLPLILVTLSNQPLLLEIIRLKVEFGKLHHSHLTLKYRYRLTPNLSSPGWLTSTSSWPKRSSIYTGWWEKKLRNLTLASAIFGQGHWSFFSTPPLESSTSWQQSSSSPTKPPEHHSVAHSFNFVATVWQHCVAVGSRNLAQSSAPTSIHCTFKCLRACSKFAHVLLLSTAHEFLNYLMPKPLEFAT